MLDAQAVNLDEVTHWKWSYRALPADQLRELASRRIDLTPEQSDALGAVLAERGMVHGAFVLPEYRGFAGFVRRHYRGDYGLARSYWIHNSLLSAVAGAIVSSALAAFPAHGKARYASLAVLLAIAFIVWLWIWGVRGTWASANKHGRRGGSEFWAVLAQLSIAFGVLGQVGQLIRLAPALREHLSVAAGEQPGAPVQFVLRADGRSLLMTGGINDDTAQALEAALAQAPGVRMLVLESGGGWIARGQEIAAVISRRRLDTYVETECSSACTIAFLAGRDRAADPRARIGFHAFRAVGAFRGARENEHEVYAFAGLRKAFVDRVRATPPQRVWYPEHQVLLREHVLTRLSEGGETAAIATDIQTRAGLAAELLKLPVHKALHDHHPERFRSLLDVAWRAVQEHRTDRELFAALGAEVSSTARALLGGVDDVTLGSYLFLLAEKATALSDAAPEACARLVLGSATRSREFRSVLPKSIRVHEQEVLVAIMETGSAARTHQFSDAEVRSMLGRVLARMKPQLAGVVRHPDSPKHGPQARCRAGLELLDILLAMPPAERALYGRALFS